MSVCLESVVSPPPVFACVAEMQNTLVPPLNYRTETLIACGRCVPKDSIGGDLMDLVNGQAESIAYVADVSGHGLRAGILMGMIKIAMRYGLCLQRPLASLLSELNRVLPQVKEPNMFATMAALRFDGSQAVEYISAGHLPLLQFCSRTRQVILHEAGQMPLGLLPGDGYVSRRIPFQPGDLFVLLTDGTVESGEEPDAAAGLERMTRRLMESHARPLEEILDLLWTETAAPGAPQDDRTILLLRAQDCTPAREMPTADLQGEWVEAQWRRILTELAAGLAGD